MNFALLTNLKALLVRAIELIDIMMTANDVVPEPGDVILVKNEPYCVVQTNASIVSATSYTAAGEYNFPLTSVQLFRRVR